MCLRLVEATERREELRARSPKGFGSCREEPDTGSSRRKPISYNAYRYHDGVKRIMIQAEEALLERARRRARERGVSLAQVVRDALERDLDYEHAPPPPLTCLGMASSTEGDLSRRASSDEYESEPYR